MGHDLTARFDAAAAAGLVLRRKTAAHVVAVARDREYLAARYGPDCLANVSQVNRLLATLDEVGLKVSRAFEGHLERSRVTVARMADGVHEASAAAAVTA